MRHYLLRLDAERRNIKKLSIERRRSYPWLTGRPPSVYVALGANLLVAALNFVAAPMA